MNEIWKDIPGYEGYYQASSLGRIKGKTRLVKHYQGGNLVVKERTLKLNTVGPYVSVLLSKEGKHITFLAHRIIAALFVPNPDNKPNVNHKDFNPYNNEADNLEWTTQQENITHSVNAGRNVKGETHGCHKLTEDQVRKIRSYDKSYKWLSEIFGVSYTSIKRIRSRKNWTHI